MRVLRRGAGEPHLAGRRVRRQRRCDVDRGVGRPGGIQLQIGTETPGVGFPRMKHAGGEPPAVVEIAARHRADGRHAPGLRRPGLCGEIALAKPRQWHGPVGIHRRQALVAAAVEIGPEGNDFGRAAGPPAQRGAELGGAVLPYLVRSEISIIAGAEICAQGSAGERHFFLQLDAAAVEGTAARKAAKLPFVPGGVQTEVGNAGGRRERVGLRGDADAHGGLAHHAGAGDPGFLVEIKALDAQIPRLLRIESARIGGGIQAHVLQADRRAEGVLGHGDGIVLGPLLGVRRGHDEAGTR